MAGTPLIRAAGGLVWRLRSDRVEIVLVHRPRYDDWSLPKGKLQVGESKLAAAVREVREEVGVEVAVGRLLGEVDYLVDDSPKTVKYWSMRERGGEFVPDTEVDELVWLPIDAARERLTHAVDLQIVDSFLQVPIPDSRVVLARHAKAGRRQDWQGDDRLRPLEDVGRRQAQMLAETLVFFAPDRTMSADRVRCVQSVEPLSEKLGVPIEVMPEFSDEFYLADPQTTLAALLAVAKPGATAVICSQGQAIPGLLRDVGAVPAEGDPTTRKAAFWVLSFRDGAVVSADYYDREDGAVD